MARTATVACLLLTALAFLPGTDAAICQTSAGCEFWDSNYHQYILYEVDTPHVDVLIVPPASPFATRDVEGIALAVDQWDAGIDAIADPWFANGFDIESYTLGLDVPSAEALADPEILVIAAEANPALLFGIGLQTPIGVCYAQEAAWHQHPGSPWGSVMAECGAGGQTCLALNTNFLLGGAKRMHDLVSHEFGHCLGIGHVGDAGDFDAKTVPLNDIMSYQYNPTHVHCVSNLDVESLQGVYAGLLGQSGQLLPGDFHSMVPSNYSQASCVDPDGSITAILNHH
jgi:hypothetical protein